MDCAKRGLIPASRRLMPLALAVFGMALANVAGGGEPRYGCAACAGAFLPRAGGNDQDESVATEDENGQAQDERFRLFCAGPCTVGPLATSDCLNAILERRMQVFEVVCRLNDAQKARLRLAGRGDIKHILEGTAEEQRAVLGDNAPDDLADDGLDAENERDLAGKPFGHNSLFGKVLQNMATPGDVGNYEAILRLEQAKARISIVEGGLRVEIDLEYAGPQVVDRVLSSLGRLRNLRSLSLRNRALTDGDLAHLEELKDLEHLDLSWTSIGNDSLKHFLGLAQLKTLRLDGTLVTGAGFEELKHLANLQELSLTGSQLDDAGLAFVTECRNLRKLELRHTRVTDAGMPDLKRLPDLERLELDGTEVSDAGMRTVRLLKGLQFLSCSRTLITHSGIAMLHRWRPKLAIAQ